LSYIGAGVFGTANAGLTALGGQGARGINLLSTMASGSGVSVASQGMADISRGQMSSFGDYANSAAWGASISAVTFGLFKGGGAVWNKFRNLQTKGHHNKTVIHQFNDIERQLDFLEKNIPGINRLQAKFLVESARAKGSNTVFGGSRVRGNYRADSDLDVGFGSLSTSQAKKLVKMANKLGGLKIEDKLTIVTGNSTKNIKIIQSPEEFFSRSGFRTDGLWKFDPRRLFKRFNASGSISVMPDGTIKVIKP